jgi:hypothetical protein
MAVTPGYPRTKARTLSSPAGRSGWVKPATSRPCGPPAAPAQVPEVGFPPVSQRMLIVRRAGAATLSHEQGHVVRGIGE